MHTPPGSQADLGADGGPEPVSGTAQDGTSAPMAPPRRARRRTRWPDLIAAAVFAFAGAMFVASATASIDGDLRLDTSGGLRDSIADRAELNQRITQDVDELSQRAEELRQQVGADGGLEALRAEAGALAPVVGLTEVIGPGVTVTLDDAPVPGVIPDGFTGDDYLVHQQDVQGVVNALWRGGASGVTVMGQRLISTSAVRCVGNTVILQGRVYSPPFVIEGVGEVADLQAALAADESVQFFRSWADVVGLGYAEETATELTLPAYTGPVTTRYAQVTQ